MTHSALRLPTTVVALLATLALAMAALVFTGLGLTSQDSAGASWSKVVEPKRGASWS